MNAILPPLVIDVRVREPQKRGFRIWFPFVILWPLLFIVVGFVLIVTALVDLALLLAGAEYHHYTALVLSTMRMLALARGTQAQINSSDDHVIDIDIY
jgi:hypothetical protein